MGSALCQACGTDREFSKPVSVILLFAPGLEKPYPLIPAEDYSVCKACDAVFTLVDKAASSHPMTRDAGSWTRAVVVFSDGHGLEVKAKRQAEAQA